MTTSKEKDEIIIALKKQLIDVQREDYSTHTELENSHTTIINSIGDLGKDMAQAIALLKLEMNKHFLAIQHKLTYQPAEDIRNEVPDPTPYFNKIDTGGSNVPGNVEYGPPVERTSMDGSVITCICVKPSVSYTFTPQEFTAKSVKDQNGNFLPFTQLNGTLEKLQKEQTLDLAKWIMGKPEWKGG